jgi:hypothetical protein
MTLTLRNIPSEVAEALERESERSKTSLDEAAIVLLRRALGVEDVGNGLVELAGTWTEEEFQRFEKAIAITEQIDEELWR